MAKTTENLARRLPCIGIWNRTASSEPTAGNTLVGLWFEGGVSRIEFFCACYQTASGEIVDPDELMVDEEGLTEPYKIVYRTRLGDSTAFWDEDIDPPDYWAECRFLIPEWR